jgi:BMFP domain-containing protein YqiC
VIELAFALVAWAVMAYVGLLTWLTYRDKADVRMREEVKAMQVATAAPVRDEHLEGRVSALESKVNALSLGYALRREVKRTEAG